MHSEDTGSVVLHKNVQASNHWGVQSFLVIVSGSDEDIPVINH